MWNVHAKLSFESMVSIALVNAASTLLRYLDSEHPVVFSGTKFEYTEIFLTTLRVKVKYRRSK